MQSSLTTVRSLALAYSARPRVSVLGTGRPALAACSFSRDPSEVLRTRLTAFLLTAPRFRLGTAQPTSGGNRGLPIPRSPLPDPSLQPTPAGPWNFDHVCIGYAFRPGLSSRLTQGGRTLPWKPWSFGGRDTLPSSLLTPAFSLPYSPPVLTVRLRPIRNAPLPLITSL